MTVRKLEDDQWVLSVPLPLQGLLRNRCRCGKGFFTVRRYERHYLSAYAEETVR